MNVWFGTSWGAPVNDLLPHVSTPVGESCLWCEESILADESGWGAGMSGPFFHVECWIRQILGSVGHQLKLCACFGGDEYFEGDNPEMSARESARAAFDVAYGLKRKDLDEA